MMDNDEAEREIEKMPIWAPDYLACWGSTRPDGKRMTVAFAADFAGTTTEAVRKLRARSEAFRRLEEITRYGTAEWAQTYVEAGLRGLAPRMMRSLARLVDADEYHTTLKLVEWLRGKPTEVKVLGSGEAGEQVVKFDLSNLPTEILRLLSDGGEPGAIETGSAA